MGLLSGGYGQGELERAGAYRVYQDPADRLRHLDDVGVRAAEELRHLPAGRGLLPVRGDPPSEEWHGQETPP